MLKTNKLPVNKLIGILLLMFSIYQVVSLVIRNGHYFFDPYYDENNYKFLESAFNHSQYRVKNTSTILPDETVFSYAAGAYIHGIDPILINSEHTPLGKYFIGLSIMLLKNDRFIVVPFAVLSLCSLWLIAKTILNDGVLALIPVAIMSSEKLFLGQLRVAPLLDIIQLPFVLLTFYFFIKELRSGKYWFTSIMLGLVISTKSVIMGGLVVTALVLTLVIVRKITSVLKLVTFLPISAAILGLSYVKTFLDGYSLWDFLGFQKWIILYQKSKLEFPFSVWRLIFLNEWQAWWGDRRLLKAEDWQFTWPLFTALSLLLLGVFITHSIKPKENVMLLISWFLVYGAFLSLGVISSRFLLPFLPITYIMGTYLIAVFGKKIYKP